MQLSNAPGKLLLPFANAGAKNTIPTASQIGITAGAASLTDGFPPLTRTPIAAGGVPPSGLDMNGILYALSAALRWANAGGGYVYDGTFAADSNVGGYPKGARVLRSDGRGYWFNTTDNNTTDPENVTAGVAAAAGWVPDFANGITSVAMTNANVTLTPVQYGKPIIVITGTLTANLNLIFPNIVNEWTVINNTAGAFTVTCKTAAGTGVVVNTATLLVGDGTNINGINAVSVKQLQSITATVASNALTLGLNPTSLDFRSSSLTSGVPNTRTVGAAISLVVPSGATLGTVSATAARLALLAIDNGGTVELAVVNLAGGNNLDETTLISTTAISAAATASKVIYSTTARTNVPFRVVGFVDISETTAGTWATAPTAIQGQGGQALSALSSLGYGQTYQSVTRTGGTTYYNTTGRPKLITAVSLSGTNNSLTVNGVDMIQFSGGQANYSQQPYSAIIPPGASYSFTVTPTSCYELM